MHIELDLSSHAERNMGRSSFVIAPFARSSYLKYLREIVHHYRHRKWKRCEVKNQNNIPNIRNEEVKESTHRKSTLRTIKSVPLNPTNSRVLLKGSWPRKKVGNALSHNFILQSSMYAAKVKGSLGMSKLIASLSWRKVSSNIMEDWSDICG
jgi:hypothetical protein